MNPETVRRMVAGWQIAEGREREERRKAGPDRAAAIQGALALMDLFGEMHDGPPPRTKPAAATTSWRGSGGSVSAVSIEPMAKQPSQKIRKALADLSRALRRIDAPSMVIGDIAVIAHGVARQTADIDATILADRLTTSQILETLAGCSIRPRTRMLAEDLQQKVRGTAHFGSRRESDRSRCPLEPKPLPRLPRPVGVIRKHERRLGG